MRERGRERCVCLQLRLSEMEMNKARNMLEHEKEIFSRPPRTWLSREHPNLGKRSPSERPTAETPQKHKKTKHSQNKSAQEEDVSITFIPLTCI